MSGNANIELGIKSLLNLLSDDYAHYKYTGPKSGYNYRMNGGIGMYYSTYGTSVFSPDFGIDATGSHTWVWDK